MEEIEFELLLMYPNIFLSTHYRCFKLWAGIDLSIWMHHLLLHRGHNFVSFQCFSLSYLSVCSGIALCLVLLWIIILLECMAALELKGHNDISYFLLGIWILLLMPLFWWPGLTATLNTESRIKMGLKILLKPVQYFEVILHK